jgi:hypothetical protein
MGYQQALEKAWNDIGELAGSNTWMIKFLADEYTVDTGKRSVLSLACNIPAKDYATIVILHYLTRRLRLKELPKPAGEWIDFKELEGGEAYYPTFKKRTIDRVAQKFGADHAAFHASIGRYPSRKASVGDTGAVIEIFKDVPILVALYKADDEFGPDANILFDKNIRTIFVTEDIVVLTEILVHSL